MTDCTLTLAYDDDAGQMVLEDLPAGPAGEAGLIPAPGLELLFDRADGRLSRVFVDAGQYGPPVVTEPALDFMTGLFGTQAGTAIAQAHHGSGSTVSLQPQWSRVADLSRLARLDSARVTSHVAQSPWWSVEAAQLAARAGLSARATVETRQAVRGMTDTNASFAGATKPAILATAELVETAHPEQARKLREHAAVHRPDQPPAAYSPRGYGGLMPPAANEGFQLRSDWGGELHWSLDPQMIPPDVFCYGLWPGSDLTVRTRETGILVEAELVPDADRSVLADCRVRLVDPARRTVLGMAEFFDVGGSRVRAEISATVTPVKTWVEVVNDASRPVISGQLRHIRRAMRWADAALMAERRAFGRDNAQRAGLAGRAGLCWERCAEDWSAAQDPDRAYLAAARATSKGPDAVVPLPLSGWAKELAGRPSLEESPFLAEGAS